MSRYSTSDKKVSSPSDSLQPERIAQWRAEVQSFCSQAWEEIRHLTEMLEAEIQQAEAFDVPAQAALSKPSSSLPERTQPADPAAETGLQHSSRTFREPSRGGVSPQETRLAELAKRIEERLQQSQTAATPSDSGNANNP